MDQSGQPSVGRQAIGNRDSPRPAVTRSVRCAGVGELDRVVDLAGEVDELGDQSLVAVARDLGARRRGERNRLGWWGKLCDLVLSLSRDSTDRIRSLCIGGEGEVGWRGGSVRGWCGSGCGRPVGLAVRGDRAGVWGWPGERVPGVVGVLWPRVVYAADVRAGAGAFPELDRSARGRAGRCRSAGRRRVRRRVQGRERGWPGARAPAEDGESPVVRVGVVFLSSSSRSNFDGLTCIM